MKNLSKSFKTYSSRKDLSLSVLSFGLINRFKNFWALKDLSFQINKGEVVGILGKNGSGKSTLLKILSGVLLATKGKNSVNGSLGTILELSAGFNPEFTGLENISFYLDLMEVPDQERDKVIEDIIEFSELSEFMDRPLKHYSSGMKSRLAFAVNTAIKPDVLFLDEVLSVGDAVFKRKSFVRMEAMIKDECTVVFVSHDLKSIREICSRVIILDRGEILYDGETADGVNIYQQLVHTPNNAKYQDFRQLLKSAYSSGDYSQIYNNDKVNLDYIPEFHSSSVKIQKHMDCDIEKVQIFDESNRQINILETGKKYKLRCFVSASIDLDSIFFRMNIKTNTSLPISSHRTSEEGLKIQKINKGDLLQVEWDFTCYLLRGNYFGNVEAYTFVDGKKQTIIRLVDVIVFKVKDALGDQNHDECGDFVYLGQKASITKVNSIS